jgi:AraC-like DNA-binding protein
LILAKGPAASLTEVAAHLGLSRQTIARSLVDAYGTSFRVLKAQMTANAARAELAKTDGRSIKEVAVALGYHPAAFARRVKQTTGASPTVLRRSRLAQRGAKRTKVPRPSSKR